MHFISNNLLHDFSNDKYMFSYKEKFYVKLRANPTRNPIDPTQTQPNRLICHVYLIHSGKYVPFGLLNSLVNIKYYQSHNKHNNFINNCLMVLILKSLNYFSYFVESVCVSCVIVELLVNGHIYGVNWQTFQRTNLLSKVWSIINSV